jgi:hypothetical protein
VPAFSVQKVTRLEHLSIFAEKRVAITIELRHLDEHRLAILKSLLSFAVLQMAIFDRLPAFVLDMAGSIVTRFVKACRLLPFQR